MKKMMLLLLISSLLTACEAGQSAPAPSTTREPILSQEKEQLPAPSASLTPSVAPKALGDSMPLQFDSSVAAYYSNDEDRTLLTVMFDVLEGRFSHFQQQYGIGTDRKVTIKLFPDYASMKPYLDGDPGVPFISGILIGDTIMIQAQNPEDEADIIIHEYTHFVLRLLEARLPDYLEEGIAMYEGMQMLDNYQRESRIYSKVRMHLLMEQPPGFADLEPPTYAEFVSVAGYEFGCVEYLISEYSYDKLVQVIQDGADWKAALNIDQETLESDWHAYLLSKYGPDAK
jgi:hypothetical protein